MSSTAPHRDRDRLGTEATTAVPLTRAMAQAGWAAPASLRSVFTSTRDRRPLCS